MELLKRIKGKPKGAPEAEKWWSGPYFQAKCELEALENREHRIALLLAEKRIALSEQRCAELVERVFEIRRDKINCLWRMGRDEAAKREQADLDERLALR